MSSSYQPKRVPVNNCSGPISGNFLARNRESLITKAFTAAGLHRGFRTLVNPTLRQAAMLARVNEAYAWWAVQRYAQRREIESGLIPLVPAASHKTALPVEDSIDDAALVEFVHRIGTERLLAAACAVEAAQ